ncbi:MAG: glycoside hydrolase family 95 protein [Oscillospiraceae bacterium]|nr:glycoside hydrolase family 95 protein [Oscillospiraceae bacterium]
MKLLYLKPTSKLRLKKPYYTGFENQWQQTALPLGNGSLGLTVMGEVKQDRLVLNHKNLWSGGPSKNRPGYSGGNITVPDKNGKMPYDYYNEIRSEFIKGNDKKAYDLCEKLVGLKDGYGSYMCWGELSFADNSIKKYKNYKRELDLSSAVCCVQYDAILKNGDTVSDKREYFVSHPDRSAVVRFTRRGGELALRLSLSSAHGGVKYGKNEIIHSGRLTDNDLKFCLFANIDTDGELYADADRISVAHATFITLIFSADTDYADKYPQYRTGESEEDLFNRVKLQADTAAKKPYNELLNAHINDYSHLFSRVQLDIGGTDDQTADKLLCGYNKKTTTEEKRRSAEQLLYDYGRYMLISSSREDDILPSNLQGIWNVSNSPIWSCDYHLNINLQMNYFPVFSGNLAECAAPLVRYINSLAIPGRLTAEYYTGAQSHGEEKNGFLFHTQNTPFGWTCPGWKFNWGWSPAAVPWILHSLYEYYEYTLDRRVLKRDIYPLLRETAEYFSGLLVEHNGRLVTVPCFSPEHGPRTLGNTYEQSLLWQLYDDASKSADVLETDCELSAKWKGIMSRLKPYEIGDDGQIKEWYHETKLGSMGEHHHRHISHLLGLYPGNFMNKVDTPELVNAAKISLNDRGDKSTGWSMGHKINCWARTGDGDRVLKIIGELFKNGIYPNFWDVHPPFQIDGNFAFAAGINEILLQSHSGFIELLPALPSKWKNGSVTGLVARGNFTVSMKWLDNQLVSAEIISNAGGICRLYYGKSEFSVNDTVNSQKGFAEFPTVKSEKYIIKTV